MSLTDQLVDVGVLKSPAIKEAFYAVPREHFLPERYKKYAEENAPVPIGHEQTNSQPLTVALMLELLAPEDGNQALDIGAGSGWTTALLAQIVGNEKLVTAIEIVPELAEQGKANLTAAGFGEIEFLVGSWEDQLPKDKTFDAILVSAVAPMVPAPLKLALNEGGRLVIPVEESASGDHVLVKLTRQGSEFAREEIPGFQFVPLV